MAQLGLGGEEGEQPLVSQTQEQMEVQEPQAQAQQGVPNLNSMQTRSQARRQAGAVTPFTPATRTHAAITAIADAAWTPAAIIQQQQQENPGQASQGGEQGAQQATPRQPALSQGGGDGSSIFYPASVAKRCVTRKQPTPEHNKREFGWQATAAAGEDQKRLSEEFKEDFLRDTVNLHILVFMTSAAPHLQLLHSVAKFYALGGNTALQHKPIGWVGDRTRKRPMPLPVFVPKQNGWTWATVKASLNTAVAEAWYADEENKGKLWFAEIIKRMSVCRCCCSSRRAWDNS